jgi:hypothetical protein
LILSVVVVVVAVTEVVGGGSSSNSSSLAVVLVLLIVVVVVVVVVVSNVGRQPRRMLCAPCTQLYCVHLFHVKESLGLKQSLTKSEALKGCPDKTFVGAKRSVLVIGGN